MQAAGLFVALALPTLLGAALLAACVRDAEAAREPGLAPWILGAGIVAMPALDQAVRFRNEGLVEAVERRALARLAIPDPYAVSETDTR